MPPTVGLLPTSTPKPPHARSTTLVRPSTLLTYPPYKSTSHTLGPDDDYAASVLAAAVSEDEWAAKFRDRAFTAPFTIFNNDTGFMEARNANGSWAGQDAGWTEGDMWAYTFDVVHDVPALIQRRGGNASFVKFLDQHFDGGEWEKLWIAALALKSVFRTQRPHQ